MLRCRKILVICILMISLAVNPLSALAETAQITPDSLQGSPEAMTVDFLLARPIGVVATVTGTAFFLLSLPFSALGGNSAEAWNSLVVGPADYTFQRPLGYYNQQPQSTDLSSVLNE